MKRCFFTKFLMATWLLSILILLNSCTQSPPNNVENICNIFHEYHDWYWDAQEVQKHWQIPISVLMAVIHQESRFRATAKPPREKLLWIIPWFRPTSAYGYSQALNKTWKRYQRETGHHYASRDAFANAADFIGWYANEAHRRIGINKGNAYEVYLAYHEGVGGYSRGTYANKQWLINVAKKVQRRAWTYHYQLLRCQASLPTKPWWHVW